MKTTQEGQMQPPRTYLVLALILTFGACSRDEPATDSGPEEEDAETLVARAGAPLFEGMGDYHRPISTASAAAQRYFDQGMVLAFGFNQLAGHRGRPARRRNRNGPRAIPARDRTLRGSRRRPGRAALHGTAVLVLPDPPIARACAAQGGPRRRRRDLQDYPRSGWSMFGLVQSLEAQDRDADAAAGQAQFETIWSMADIALHASRI
jgi:hypothetical protein